MDNLRARGIRIDERCHTCGFEGESINHVIFTCSAARQVCRVSDISGPRVGFGVESLYSNVSYILSLQKKLDISLHLKEDHSLGGLAYLGKIGMLWFLKEGVWGLWKLLRQSRKNLKCGMWPKWKTLSSGKLRMSLLKRRRNGDNQLKVG